MDEIEGLNISMVVLHQQIQSIKTAPKILGKEHGVVHKGNKENFLLLRRLFEILRELYATSPGFYHNNSLLTTKKHRHHTGALFEGDEVVAKCLILFSDSMLWLTIVMSQSGRQLLCLRCSHSAEFPLQFKFCTNS